MVDLRKELCFKWETDVSKSQGVKVNYDLQTAWSMQPECYQTDCNQILYFSTHWIIKEDEELRMTHFLLINCFRQFAAASLLLRDKRERDWHYSQMLEADNVSDMIQIWREVLSWCVRSNKIRKHCIFVASPDDPDGRDGPTGPESPDSPDSYMKMQNPQSSLGLVISIFKPIHRSRVKGKQYITTSIILIIFLLSVIRMETAKKWKMLSRGKEQKQRK